MRSPELEELITQLQVVRKMAQSKVTQVQGAGTWNELYKFEYTFEDGTVLTAFHKTAEAPFKAGDLAEYEVRKENQYGKTGGVGKPQEGNYQPRQQDPDKQKNIARSVALNNAVALHAGATTDAGVVLETANTFEAWLNR